MIGKRFLGVFGLATLAAVLGGCDTHEKYSYASTPSVPQTVTLKNTTTGEQLWSYDIPPGQELKLWFTNPAGRANEQGFDEMVWTAGPASEGIPVHQNRMRVPPPMSRRIEGSVRAPEMMPPRASVAPAQGQ